MINSSKELRAIIREAIYTANNITMAETESNSNNSRKPDVFNWMYFEEFGSRILVRIGYTGDFDVLYEIKKELEENSGWEFDQ